MKRAPEPYELRGGAALPEVVDVRFFLLDTSYACGVVAAQEETGVVVAACPIYRRFVGQPLNAVIRRLRAQGRFRRWEEIRNLFEDEGVPDGE